MLTEPLHNGLDPKESSTVPTVEGFQSTYENIPVQADDNFNDNSTIEDEKKMSIAIPDGWEMVTGTWGTDADQETVVVQSANTSIKLKNTNVATKIRTPIAFSPKNAYGSQEGFTGGINSSPIAAWFYIRQSNITAGNTITVKVEQYTSVGTLLYTNTIYSGTLPVVNTWYTFGDLHDLASTDNGYIRLTIEKSSNTFDVYIDSVFGVQSAPIGLMFGTGTDSIVDDGTWRLITFPTATPYDVDIVNTGGTLAEGFRIVQPGTYNISGQVYTSDVDDPGGMQLRLRIATSSTTYIINLGAATSSTRVPFSTNFLFDNIGSVYLEGKVVVPGLATYAIGSISGNEHTWHTYMNIVRIGR